MQSKEALKYRLRDYVESITQKAPDGNYICPICGSGSHKNGTSGFKVFDEQNGIKSEPYFHCFAGNCEAHGDIFTLIGIHEGIEGPENFDKQLAKARELYDPDYSPSKDKRQQREQQRAAHEEKAPEEPPADYTEKYREWNSHLPETDYHRGISLETLNRFNVGYCAKWKHPKNENNSYIPFDERLIIPTSKSSYVARAIDPKTPDKYKKIKAGNVRPINLLALDNATQPIFIVEGELDALSIIDVGGEAIGLGGVGLNYFFSQVENRRIVQPLIAALDDDETGKKSNIKLVEGLNERGINAIMRNPCIGCKDANEALNTDRERFKEEVARISQEVSGADVEQLAKEDEEKAKKAAIEEYRDSYSNAAFMDAFRSSLTDRKRRQYFPTCFPLLNDLLDGGLREGLTVLGALSSLGKTTFILQLADELAASGADVLFFTLEQSREELIAKSISRLSYLNDEDPEKRNAKTARDLYRADLNLEEHRLICDCLDEYERTMSRHLFFYEGIIAKMDVAGIRERVEEHKKTTGKTPIVFVDYLQILKPDPANAAAYDTKQNIDNIVSDLRVIARDYHIPVICLSSFNRGSYNKKADMTAFKESGGIEYSSDVLITLELGGIKQEDDEKAAAGKIDQGKRKLKRDIELKLLKNRGGALGEPIKLLYDTRFNYFEEKER